MIDRYYFFDGGVTESSDGYFVYYADHASIIKELLDYIYFLGHTNAMDDRIAELRKEYGE